MKKIIFILLAFSLIQEIHAQNDSIAMSQMNKLGVYYFRNDTLVQIIPIVTENIRTSGSPFSAKASMVYEGEDSEHILSNTPTFYVFIPKVYNSMISVKQFRMVTLTSQKGTRSLNAVSIVPFAGRTGAKTQAMNITTLNEECYKICAKEVMPAGHYGIFYNYGNGIPHKLYDFDIKK